MYLVQLHAFYTQPLERPLEPFDDAALEQERVPTAGQGKPLPKQNQASLSTSAKGSKRVPLLERQQKLDKKEPWTHLRRKHHLRPLLLRQRVHAALDDPLFRPHPNETQL